MLLHNSKSPELRSMTILTFTESFLKAAHSMQQAGWHHVFHNSHRSTVQGFNCLLLHEVVGVGEQSFLHLNRKSITTTNTEPIFLHFPSWKPPSRWSQRLPILLHNMFLANLVSCLVLLVSSILFTMYNHQCLPSAVGLAKHSLSVGIKPTKDKKDISEIFYDFRCV